MSDRQRLAESELTNQIIGAFFRVHNELGYGFLEHPYVHAMERALRKAKLTVGREVGVRLYYDGDEIGQYRLDMIVNERVVVEIKSSFELHHSAHRQLYNYLRASNLEVGLLLHFGPRARFFRAFCPSHRKPHRIHP